MIQSSATTEKEIKHSIQQQVKRNDDIGNQISASYDEKTEAVEKCRFLYLSEIGKVFFVVASCIVCFLFCSLVSCALRQYYCLFESDIGFYSFF